MTDTVLIYDGSEEAAIALPRSRASAKPLLCAAAVIGALLLAAIAGFDFAGGAMDEATLLVYPERILRGDVPYRDFESFYGPANAYLLSGVYALFGTTITVERTAGLLYRVAILAGIYWFARRFNFFVACGAVFVGGILLVSLGLYAYAWTGAAACAIWSIAVFSGETNRYRYFLAGLLAGVALLFRQDFAPAMLLAAAPFAIGASSRDRLLALAGCGLAFIPLALLTGATGFRPVLDNLFLIPVLSAGPARHLSWGNAAIHARWLFVAHVIGSAINCIAGYTAVRRERTTASRSLLSFALMSTALTHQAVQRMDTVHVLFAAFASLALVPVSFYSLGKRLLPENAPRAVVSCFAAVLLLALLAPETLEAFRCDISDSLAVASSAQLWVEQNGRSFRFASEGQARATRRVLDQLQRMSREGERLFVGPADLRRTNYTDTFFYHLMPQLVPATYFIEMNPRSANRPGSRLATDMATADWLVLDRSLDSWHEANGSAELGPNEPNDVVRSQFILRGEFGAYQLYSRRTAESVAPAKPQQDS